MKAVHLLAFIFLLYHDVEERARGKKKIHIILKNNSGGS